MLFYVLVSFCRSECPIEISRWVLCKIICENYLCYYVYKRCVCITCIWIVLQSGWGGEEGEEEGTVVAAVAIHCKEVYQAREVALVVKMHIYSLSLLPFEWRCVILRNNHRTCYTLPCSNYDRRYYHKRYHIPTDSEPNPEEHEYGPEDPLALPW